jgi:SET domain-containing protein
MPTSYTSNKLEVRRLEKYAGYGVYAKENLPKGELLIIWGGKVASKEEFDQCSLDEQVHSIQIEESFFLVPVSQGDAADFVNHSCNPNAGISGQICLVAMRDITAGEEICFDYAMSESQTGEDEFDCSCGSIDCRKHIRWADWEITALQQKYRGYFMPYLQRRIDRLG